MELCLLSRFYLMVIVMLIYKKVIADYLKNKYETVEMASMADDGTLFISICGSCDLEKLSTEIKSEFPRIKKVCVARMPEESVPCVMTAQVPVW